MSANLPPQEPERPSGDDSPADGSPTDAPPTGASGPRRFLRSRSDRVLGGVAAGVGRYLGVDPIVVRITFVALTLFGGAGALLYLAMLLLVPNEDEVAGGAGPAKPAPQHRGLVILGVVALVVIAGPLLFVPALFAGGIIVPLTILVLIGLGVAWLVTGRRPERDAASLTKATLLGLGMLVLLAIVSVAAFWGAGVGGGAVVAGIVIAAGVALVVAAFARPARWLILPALAAVLPALFVSAAGIDLDGGFGEKHYAPSSAAALQDRYQIGAGQLTLDLRRVDLPAGDRHLDVDVGMGEAVVIVPKNVCVATDARVGAGAISLFDRENGGIDVDMVDSVSAPTGTTRLVLSGDIGLGHLDVRNTDPDTWGARTGSSRVRDDWSWDHRSSDRGRNDACAA